MTGGAFSREGRNRVQCDQETNRTRTVITRQLRHIHGSWVQTRDHTGHYRACRTHAGILCRSNLGVPAKKAAQRADNLRTLHLLLAEHVESKQERDRFLETPVFPVHNEVSRSPAAFVVQISSGLGVQHLNGVRQTFARAIEKVYQPSDFVLAIAVEFSCLHVP